MAIGFPLWIHDGLHVVGAAGPARPPGHGSLAGVTELTLAEMQVVATQWLDPLASLDKV